QKTKNGKTRDVLVTTRKLMLAGRALLHTTWHDISDCTRVERELKESIRDLEQEKVKTEAIMNAIGEGISIRDRDFRILYQNQTAIDVSGDHTGEVCYEAIHGREQICEGCPVVLSFRDGKIHTAEQNLTTKDGKQYFASTASPIRDSAGNIIAAVELTRNITDNKRAEQELKEANARMESLLNAIPDLVLFKDAQRRCQVVNKAVAKSCGLRREEMLGKIDEEYFPPEIAAMCRASDENAMKASGPVHSEESTVGHDGETIYLDTIKAPMHDEHGNLAGVVMVSRDITERKNMEEALRLTYQRKLRAQEMAHVGNCEWTLDKEERYWSEETVIGHDGETIFLDTIKAPMHDEHGNLAGVVVVSRDITERKKMEEALRLTYQRKLRAQRMAQVGNWEWTLDKEELYWSEEIYRIYGRDPEDFTPTFKAVQGAMHPDDLEPFLQGLDAALNQNIPFEMDYRLIRPDGMERTIHTIGEVMYDPAGKALGLSGTVQDITERKQLEAKAWEQYATLESIIESSENPIFSVDHRYCYTSFNQQHATVMQELYGAEIELGQSILDFISEKKDRSLAKVSLDRALNGENVLLEDYFGKKKEARIFEASYNPIRDMNGMVLGASLYARDTTERRRAEEQLKASEKRLRDLTANLGVGLYMLDDKGNITFMNPMAEQLWGWSLKELQEKGTHDLVHYRKADGTPLPPEECEIMGVVKKGRPYFSMDEVFVRKDGTVFPVSVTATPLKEEGRIVASITAFRDITAEKKLEAELLKIQKLESVGILAGGIAHDFNNLLQAILGSISLARLSLEQFDLAAVPSLLKQAEEASEAARELSFRLLTFAKGGDPIKTLSSVEEIIRKSVSLSLSGSRIHCRIDLSPDLAPVKVDAGQIVQVFNNIFINAKEAMPNGGTIGINAKNVTIQKDANLPLKKGRYLHISVQDDGCGIPEEYLARIFDPYFSMKGMGSKKGSGLGLSISMAIIRKHDGHIHVESPSEQGATFHIYIPSSPEPLPIQKPEKEKLPAISKKRILFMDDDERVRQLAGEMLTRLGCEVECACHGEEAVALYQEARAKGRPFTGVILDLTIKGGMGGDKAIAGLQQIDPQVKAVIASGYA
ncbi:MAG: PAS domain S-box protein, partial [Deltaproteobacteria bacterium]